MLSWDRAWNWYHIPVVNVGYNFSKTRAHIYCDHLLLFVNCFACAGQRVGKWSEISFDQFINSMLSLCVWQIGKDGVYRNHLQRIKHSLHSYFLFFSIAYSVYFLSVYYLARHKTHTHTRTFICMQWKSWENLFCGFVK